MVGPDFSSMAHGVRRQTTDDRFRIADWRLRCGIWDLRCEIWRDGRDETSGETGEEDRGRFVSGPWSVATEA